MDCENICDLKQKRELLKRNKTRCDGRTKFSKSTRLNHYILGQPIPPSVVVPNSILQASTEAIKLRRLGFISDDNMETVEVKSPSADGKIFGLFKLPFRNQPSTTSSSSNFSRNRQNNGHGNNRVRPQAEGSAGSSGSSVSFAARSLLPTRRRLKLEPSNKLYFPYEPGKQVRSAIRIKNMSKFHVAFKFQTTAPKSCFMRPPGAILAPGESIVATVFKFVEHPENNEKPMNQKSSVKFKIMSLKVNEPMDYIPEMFDEQKDQVAVEQILRVVFLDAERPNPALDKLKRQLAEAEAELVARKKDSEDTGPKFIGEGLVIDEWKERREKYLARQQAEGEGIYSI